MNKLSVWKRGLLTGSACLSALAAPPDSGNLRDRRPDAAGFLSSLPLAFEVNQGQFAPEAKFVTRGNDFALVLTEREAMFTFGPASSRGNVPPATATMRMPGAAAREPKGERVLPGVANYLTGNDPSGWHTGVSEYERVRYADVYPGIDLVYYGNGRNLEYDFVLAPHAEVAAITLAFSGVTALKLDDRGDLVMKTGGRTILQHRPVAYQETSGKRRAVAAGYVVTKGRPEVRIAVGTYDHSRALVIDPVLDYGTFFGGSGDEGANYLAVDGSGNTYVAGATTSTNLPLSSSGGRPQGGKDAYVAKLNTTGTALVYTTYLGGTGQDEATSLAVNSSGIVSVCGVTNSPDFPTAGTSQFPRGGGVEDGFVSILNSNGNGLVYSTYFGGSGDDAPGAIAIDASSNVYVAGRTTSVDFPGIKTTSAQSRNAGGYDAFAAKFSGSGALLYSTFFGSTGDESATSIAVAPSGNAFIVGASNSPGLPGGAIGNRASGKNTFIAGINGTGTLFTGSRFLGGSSDQNASAVFVDSSGSIYITGTTNSGDFPTTGDALQKTSRGGYDAFVTKVSVSGASFPITYSTYLGGSGTDTGYSIVVDRNGRLYVAGYTESADFLLSGQQPPGGRKSTFIVELALNSFPSIPFVAYLGAHDGRNPVTLALRAGTAADEIMVAGYADNAFQFPSSGRPPGTFGGGLTDAFIAKLAAADLAISDNSNNPQAFPSGVASLIFKVSNQGPAEAQSVVVTVKLDDGLTALICSARSACTVSKDGTVSVTYPNLAAGDSDTITVLVKAKAGTGGTQFSVAYSASVASGTNDPNPANNIAFGAFTVLAGVSLLSVNPPDILDFSTVAMTQTVQKPIMVTPFPAAGAVDVRLSVVPYPGTPTGIFSLVPGAQTSFTTAKAFMIPINFTPDGAGDRTALLRIGTNGFETGVILTGTGASVVTGTPLHFVPLTPCRVADSRFDSGPLGGPVGAGKTRDYVIPSSSCKIPPTALAYALNVTVVPRGPLDYLTIFPTGLNTPPVSTLTSNGQIRANAAIVAAGVNGSVTVFVTQATDVILDTSGYFVSDPGNNALAFYPVEPCRVFDTRQADGVLGGPEMQAGMIRSFSLQGPCDIPASAKAYSVNFTVIPTTGSLGYLTAWPAGEALPGASTLNNPSGVILANAAIVEAGTGGAISAYVTDRTHVFIDINGYFAPPGAAGALSFYAVTPCRISDTRAPAGSFGPTLADLEIRRYPIPSGTCSIPDSAKAFSLNATLLAPDGLDYLTFWAWGTDQPNTSNLNSPPGAAANAAIVSGDPTGSISAFVTNRTDLILDINGYFAP